MTEQKWISINPADFNKNQSEVVDGVEIIVGMSPYDLPEGVRGRFDKEIDRFVIEFKYLDGNESLIPDDQDDHVTLQIGEHSGRLYQVFVDVKSLEASTVGLKMLIPQEVKKAIKGLAKERTRNSKHNHYKVTRDVISEKQNEIFAGV